MNVKHRIGAMPGAVRMAVVGGIALALIGSGTAVAFAGTPNETGGTPAMSTTVLPALGADGQLIDPTDLPEPGEGPTWQTATIDENGNVSTAEGTGTPPPPGRDGSPMAPATGVLGEPISGAKAALMKLIEVGSGETVTETFTAPEQAPKLGDVQPAPAGLDVTSAVTGAGTADDPQVITLTITNTTDGAVSGPVGVSFVQ
jgi:hypothetical protein